MSKEKNGIRLVPLVLMIIVLLIIAGVAFYVVVQNADGVQKNPGTSINNGEGSSVRTSYADASSKVKLIFELCEANYQTELAKGNVTDRSEVFTASNIISLLNEYNVTGNTQNSLGEIDLINGITVNYGGEYKFLVRVSNSGIVTVIED